MFWKQRPTHWTEEGREWIGVLARYNSEVHRGIMHTDEWKAQMMVLQQRFDEATAKDHPATW